MVDAAAAPLTAEIKVEIDEIDRSKVAEVTKRSDVVCAAPVMPMKLIAPLDVEAVDAQPAATEVAWGVKAVGADTSPFSGAGIVIAVLDTGIDKNHPAFAGVQITERDFTGEGNGDNHGHGTHCAGTIFGRTTASRRIGVATGVKQALIGKVLGKQGGGSDTIANAIQWAVENGANVISMSLGIDFPGFVKQMQEVQHFPPELATTRALEGYRANVQLFERLASLIRARAGFGPATVIVAAAGNESQRDVNPDFEIAVSPPAVSEGIISVAALGQSPAGLVVAPFSNTGANVSGPGVASDLCEARWRISVDERYQHGDTSRGGGNGVMGGKNSIGWRPQRFATHGQIDRLRYDGGSESRFRPLRYRGRPGARAAMNLAAKRSADRALECPTPNMSDLLLHGARERNSARRYFDQVLLGDGAVREARLCHRRNYTLLDLCSRPAGGHGSELIQIEFGRLNTTTIEMDFENFEPLVIDRKIDKKDLIEAPFADHFGGKQIDAVRSRRHKEAARLLLHPGKKKRKDTTLLSAGFGRCDAHLDLIEPKNRRGHIFHHSASFHECAFGLAVPARENFDHVHAVERQAKV